MGFLLTDTNVPIMKGSNGIIAVDTDHTVEQPCIKCGRCMDVCPMELSPLYFAKFADEENWQGMKRKMLWTVSSADAVSISVPPRFR